ncbi:MAG: isopenicillin N synthase family oxygenase [Planctomycetes bacterium]|nr:isopenicillin N synthase family oxygenase [Planctomycetota bacterium]
MLASVPLLELPTASRPAAGFATRLQAAWRDFGFVGIRGHGIAPAVIAAGLATARAFFALPEAIKRRYEVVGGAGQRGYTRFRVEKARDQRAADLKEFWHVGREVGRDHPLAAMLLPNLWPDEVLGFQSAQLALFAELERLGSALLSALAPTLGLPIDWFARRIAQGNSILRSIHYPPLPAAGATGADLLGAAVRAAAHEDINLITLLVGSDEPGLEILTRQGDWLPITTLPGTIVVNVGDMLQRLTNGVLPSTTHRVVNPPPPWDARSRHSIPFFLHFEPEVVIEPLASCVSDATPARWPPIRVHDYLQERLREIGLVAD